MKTLFVAFRFLTVIPLPGALDSTEADLERSVYLFPVVGIIIGAFLAALDASLAAILPVLPASAALVLALAAITGGLHLDGLADTAAGFMSSRPRTDIGDHEGQPNGTHGGDGYSVGPDHEDIVAGVGHRTCATGDNHPDAGGRALGHAHNHGYPPLCPSGRGAGESFHAAPLAAADRVGSFFPFGLRLGRSRPARVRIALHAAVTALAGFYMHRKIRGLTGDTLGAACEIVETIPLLTAVVGIQRGLIS
jgi:adenosylcobinamide-GDP ribazoletransferase